MPQPSKGPRLFKRKRKGEGGRQHVWIIKDEGKRISTGIAAKSTEHRPPVDAEKALEAYLAQKNTPDRKLRDIDSIPISDVLSIYYEDKVESFQDPIQKRRFISRIKRLTVYFGKPMLGDMTTKLTQGYEKKRGNSGGARRDLEDLRAAINHHASENLHHGVVKVKLPEKGEARLRWLERSEAARLLWACWRHKEEQTIHRGKNKGIKIKTGKYTLRHVARFILIGLYTGTRASAIAAASPCKKEGHAYVDLDAGLYHRLAIGRRATNKRQPTVPIPDRLLAHMRRWYDKGIIANHFVEWNGIGVKSVKNGFARGVEVANLDLSDGNVTPHTLRHTAATWLMQLGTDPWQASGYLGMSVKVLLDTYGHHHPDYMREASGAITRKRETTKRLIGAPQVSRPAVRARSIRAM
jgi:integrase